MPVTKTARRALRGSKNKASVNKAIINRLEVAIRMAKTSKTVQKVVAAVSLADRAAKKRVIHKNKASRIKSQLSKIVDGKKTEKSVAKTSSKTKAKKAK